MSTSRRTLIGRSTSLTGREAVWQRTEGLEIQSKEGYEIVHRQVLFEDITFITYHRQYGAAYLAITGIITLFFFAIAIAILAASVDAWPAALTFALFGAPALIAFALRLMFRLDIITVFGKRTKASIRFRLRKKRAREVYAQIVSAVRTAQARTAREIAAEEAAAVGPVTVAEEAPPMPPAGIENQG